VLRLVEDEGLPAERLAAPEPVSTLDGQTVLVTEFVAGTAPRPSYRMLAGVADVLGRLHALPDGGGRTGRAGGSLHHIPAYEGLPGRDLALAAAFLDDIADRIPDALRPPFERLRRAVATADDCADLPHALVHPDPVPVNVVATADRRMVLVDWTGAGRGPRIVSLASLLSATRARGSWDGAKVAAVAAAYGPHVQLTADEIDRLGAAVRLRRLWLAAWNYWTHTVRGRPPAGDEWWIPRDPAVEDALVPVARAAFT
jgi:Ser/Thr protein kinase RdoA (MazF antagonist)